MKVLVTGCGGPAGVALIAQLAARDIPVVGVDMNPELLAGAVGAVATHQVPAASDPGMMPALQRIVADEGVDLVIPTVSEELPQFAVAADPFGPQVHVVIGGTESVEAAHDKLATCRVLRSQQVAVPAFDIATHFADAAAAHAHMGSPLVVKPRISRGGRGVRVSDAPGDLDWATVDERHLVQQFVSGTEYAPVVYQPRSGSAAAPLVVVLEKVQLKEGRVGNAVGVRRLAPAAARDVADLAQAAVEALGLVGPADVDVRRDADGRPYVLEVNARFGANSASVPELLDLVLAQARAGQPVSSAP